MRPSVVASTCSTPRPQLYRTSINLSSAMVYLASENTFSDSKYMLKIGWTFIAWKLFSLSFPHRLILPRPFSTFGQEDFVVARLLAPSQTLSLSSKVRNLIFLGHYLLHRYSEILIDLIQLESVPSYFFLNPLSTSVKTLQTVDYTKRCQKITNWRRPTN